MAEVRRLSHMAMWWEAGVAHINARNNNLIVGVVGGETMVQKKEPGPR